MKTLDLAYVLHADHGFNASTFSALVTTSTLSDIYSAVTTAIGRVSLIATEILTAVEQQGFATAEIAAMISAIVTSSSVKPFIRRPGC